MAMRVLIDTNILLDYLICRKPFDTDARKIVKACSEKKIDGCIAAHSIPNMFYILRKSFSTNERRMLLQDICELFVVEGIDKAKLVSALKNEDFSDFEDCLQMECAEEFGADFIVTRNVNDYKGSSIPGIEPDRFCNMLDEKK